MAQAPRPPIVDCKTWHLPINTQLPDCCEATGAAESKHIKRPPAKFSESLYDTSSLSDLNNRSEDLFGRGQTPTILQTNSDSYWAKKAVQYEPAKHICSRIFLTPTRRRARVVVGHKKKAGIITIPANACAGRDKLPPAIATRLATGGDDGLAYASNLDLYPAVRLQAGNQFSVDRTLAVSGFGDRLRLAPTR